jgi:hypothetical protein
MAMTTASPPIDPPTMAAVGVLCMKLKVNQSAFDRDHATYRLGELSEAAVALGRVSLTNT